MVWVNQVIKDTDREAELVATITTNNHIHRETIRMKSAILHRHETSEGPLLSRMVRPSRRFADLPGLQKLMGYRQDHLPLAMLDGPGQCIEGWVRVRRAESECRHEIEVGLPKSIRTFQAIPTVMTGIEAGANYSDEGRERIEFGRVVTGEIKSIGTLDGGEVEVQRESEIGTGSCIGGEAQVPPKLSCIPSAQSSCTVKHDVRKNLGDTRSFKGMMVLASLLAFLVEQVRTHLV